MSAPQDKSAGSSSKKRKFDNDDRADRKRAKKQRRAEARERLEAEAAGNGQNDSSEVAVGDSEGQKKKKKRKRKHSKAGDEAQRQEDHEPPSTAEPATNTKKEERKEKKKAKRHELRKQRERKSTNASSEALRAGKPSTSNPHLSQEKSARIQAWSDQSESETSKVKAKKEHKKRLKLEKRKSNATWTLSSPSAGRYLDHDPIFVRDVDGEEFLVSANQREMQLLSLETSLVVRTAAVPKGRSIRCFASAAPDEGVVRVALDDGSVCSWDWRSDADVRSDFKAAGPVTAMALAKSSQEETSRLVYLPATSGKSGIYMEGSDEALFRTAGSHVSVQVFGDTDYIVAHSNATVVVGMKKDGESDSRRFLWTVIPTIASLGTCVDGRLIPVDSSNKKAKQQRPGLSLAVGHSDGQIHLYDDVSAVSGQRGKRDFPIPRVLHWHRESVSSVKFSSDGNYLISGGKETVLVIWQLQTGKKQFLPHLTSTIERIVVNPKGDRYALQMGDNSIMVLSTSELKPVANFAGLQMSPRDASTGRTDTLHQAATLHPRDPSQILLAVPSTRPSSVEDITPRAFLQSFDFSTSRHIARQALTRNNVTDFNLGPEGQPIHPPDVTHVAISQDGSWLATVDEWMPPANDLEHLASNDADLDALRQTRREVYLKFWKWSESENLWTLTTRVDSPCSTTAETSTGAGRILALIPDPSTNAFASVGDDCCVKIWKSKRRKRHGVAITDRSDTELISWTCKRNIQLPRSHEQVDSPFPSPNSNESSTATACLSYAADGSMLAATVSLSTPTPADASEEAQIVYFINPATGENIAKPGLTAHEVVAMGFLDQFFVAVDRVAAYVWDLINERVVYKVRLSSSKKREIEGEGWHVDAQAMPGLTIDTAGSTFALTTGTTRGREEESGNAKTKLEVYGPKEPLRLFETTFKTPVEAVLASPGTKGYTLLFGDATVRTLAPATSVSTRMRGLPQPETRKDVIALPAIPEPEEEEEEEEMDVDVDASAVAAGAEMRGVDEQDEDDRPVVRPEQLASLFDTPQSFALPPVREMFGAIIGLFSRRPFSRPAGEAA